MSTVRADLRRLTWWQALGLILAALVVLGLRAFGLIVFFVVDTAERLEVIAAAALHVAPVSSHVVISPTPVPDDGWTPEGDDD